MKLDRNKTYGEVFGADDGKTKYWQDGIAFDVHGEPIDPKLRDDPDLEIRKMGDIGETATEPIDPPPLSSGPKWDFGDHTMRPKLEPAGHEFPKKPRDLGVSVVDDTDKTEDVQQEPKPLYRQTVAELLETGEKYNLDLAGKTRIEMIEAIKKEQK